jgi:hypothetical protein
MAHYVVLEGLEDGKSSDYTIQATGNIEMVEGTLGGVSVVKDEDLDINGSSVSTTVWSKADGYRIYGGLRSIEIDRPDNVQVYAGEVSDRQSTEGCEFEVRAKNVEFVEGQGAGEGALEVEIAHDINGEQSVKSPQTRLPTGSSVNLGDVISGIHVPAGQSEEITLTTYVTEHEVPRDWWTGQDDSGQNSKTITLVCGETQEVSMPVSIDSDRGNPGKVRVNYVIGDQST